MAIASSYMCMQDSVCTSANLWLDFIHSAIVTLAERLYHSCRRICVSLNSSFLSPVVGFGHTELNHSVNEQPGQWLGHA